MESNNLKKLFLVFGILLLISVVASAKHFNKNCESSCEESYLGICFDEDSIFYKCNMDEDMCSLKDWDSANVMKFMENNNLVIYGSSKCGWCNKQIEEFGNLGKFLEEKGLYFDCYDSSKNSFKEICSDIKGTPTWKKNNKIVKSGYIPLEEIINSFN